MGLNELNKELLVTCEIIGHRLSDAAVEAMLMELSVYDERAVIASLRTCRKILRHKLTLSDVISHLPGGHPGVEAAWAIVAPSFHDEGRTFFWTDEMAEAAGAAWPLCDDRVAARLAFKEKYAELLATVSGPPRWRMSRGTNKALVAEAVKQAVAEGKITVEAGVTLLPHEDFSDQEARALLGAIEPRLLA